MRQMDDEVAYRKEISDALNAGKKPDPDAIAAKLGMDRSRAAYLAKITGLVPHVPRRTRPAQPVAPAAPATKPDESAAKT